MLSFKNFLVAIGAFAINAFAAETCDCYTASVIETCPPVPGCVTPACVSLTTKTIPAHNTNCPVTPTLTALPLCIQTCIGGCATWTETVTASETCLPTTTPPPPSPPKPGCYTHTTAPMPSICPQVTDCITLACLEIRTSTVPAVDRKCPVTPTVTTTPACIPTCPGGCAVSWTTAKARATRRRLGGY